MNPASAGFFVSIIRALLTSRSRTVLFLQADMTAIAVSFVERIKCRPLDAADDLAAGRVAALRDQPHRIPAAAEGAASLREKLPGLVDGNELERLRRTRSDAGHRVGGDRKGVSNKGYRNIGAIDRRRRVFDRLLQRRAAVRRKLTSRRRETECQQARCINILSDRQSSPVSILLICLAVII
jgi:hypothetical protein